MQSPGPGQYLGPSKNEYYDNPSTKFGHEDRFATAKEKGPPGPGTYNFNDLNAVKPATPNVRFGRDSREYSPDSKRDTPGPGAYNKKGIIG